MKRAFDLIVSITCFTLFLPLIIITTILIKIKLGSPVIFKQQRPGLNDKPFVLYKFRSMTDERDENGDLLPDHIRLTQFGKLLRQLSLDELPQLLNVIKGEMSLVGPRPLMMEYLPLYTTEQARRHLVKPGITGWAQVNGRNAITWEEKFKMDVWYVDNRNFFLDMKILFLTVKKVLVSDGVSNMNHVTMPDFEGETQSKKPASYDH
ncbi:putative sugar transferase EpsL [Siminovitchia terrae]|uniref:Sugar transferase n=1 Tax=Siminovitchia terrae TaxID=1914933 RepID=A0A429X9X6_SIMTE|nr:sugar transferase [Siminovitchia terrae]RST60210.1 sugar transferase [Siminovitchia terrae]GIN92575.1 putative sugar transferase EpsL [Siminovitchia terrae]GIN97391.1 putative sugar transferase EpsL [Siminovitchia terrae]